MATATLKRVAFAAGGVGTVLAALTAATLIWMVLTSPEQAALAMAEGDFLDVLGLAFDRMATLCLRLVRWL